MILRRCSRPRTSVGLALTGPALLVSCDGASPPTEPVPDEINPPVLTGLLVDPLVIRRGQEGARLTATAAGGDVSGLQAIHIHLHSTYAALADTVWPDQELRVDGEAVTAIRLVDDGTSGDEAPGDGIFSFGRIGLREEPLTPIGATYPMYVPQVDWEFEDTLVAVPRQPEDRIRVAFHDVDPFALGVPPVSPVGSDAQRTPHLVVLAIADPVAAFAGETLTGPELSQAYLERFEYEPDFLLTYQVAARRVGGFEGQFARVLNTAEGIGLPPVDHRDVFGSSGTLKGVVVIRSAPHPVVNGLTIHELNHHRAAYLDSELGVSDAAHWTRGLDRDYDGFSGSRFNDVELYLMGLLPPDSVIPAVIGTNGSTIEDLVALHGPRIPAWPDAPSGFTAANVIVHHRLLQPAELALFDFLAADLGSESPDPRRVDPRTRTFFEATGGRARLTTRIP